MRSLPKLARTMVTCGNWRHAPCRLGTRPLMKRWRQLHRVRPRAVVKWMSGQHQPLHRNKLQLHPSTSHWPTKSRPHPWILPRNQRRRCHGTSVSATDLFVTTGNVATAEFCAAVEPAARNLTSISLFATTHAVHFADIMNVRDAPYPMSHIRLPWPRRNCIPMDKAKRICRIKSITTLAVEKKAMVAKISQCLPGEFTKCRRTCERLFHTYRKAANNGDKRTGCPLAKRGVLF
jgi:hypothetical protein